MIIPELSSAPAILHQFQLMNAIKTRKASRARWLRKLKKIRARARNARIRCFLRPLRQEKKLKIQVNPIVHFTIPPCHASLKNNYKNF